LPRHLFNSPDKMSLNQDIALLEKLPLLGALEHEALRLVAFAGESREYRVGDVLFHENEPTDGGYVITDGLVELRVLEGHPASMSVGVGALIGELALFIDGTRPATGIAQLPTTALKITRQVFRRVLSEFPQSAILLHRRLAERSLGARHQLEAVRQALNAIQDEPI
jgi:CRP-like cAMP-binding protein